MVKETCPFGAAFRLEREARGISQWALALKISCHPRNLQRIEYGEQQPGVMKALQLLSAIDCKPGFFLASLATKTGVIASFSPTQIQEHDYVRPHEADISCLFGPLLKQAREHMQFSQTALAKRAEYNLRNINAVEAGRQEPGIMIALRLVAATEANLQQFFDSLFSLQKDV